MFKFLSENQTVCLIDGHKTPRGDARADDGDCPNRIAFLKHQSQGRRPQAERQLLLASRTKQQNVYALGPTIDIIELHTLEGCSHHLPVDIRGDELLLVGIPSQVMRRLIERRHDRIMRDVENTGREQKLMLAVARRHYLKDDQPLLFMRCKCWIAKCLAQIAPP